MGVKATYFRTVNKVKRLFRGDLEDWQDPRVQYENAVDHHVPLRLLDDATQAHDAVAQDRGETKWVQFIAHRERPVECLFKLYPNPASCPQEMVAAVDGADLKGFSPTKLPSNWQVERPLEDPPIYTNITFPWKRSRMLSSSVPKMENPTGCYRIEFDVAQEWLQALKAGEREAFLILHGAGAGVRIYVNGAYVGYGQDSMTETEVPIGGANLKATGNVLTLVVIRWTDGSYLEDQDQWWLSGVFRDVELSCRPKSHGIKDYFYEVNASRTQAEVNTYVLLNGSATSRVRVSLFNAEGTQQWNATVESSESQTYGPEKLQAAEQCAEISLTINEPIYWSVQNPYLYILVLESLDPNDNVVQVEASRIGIRTVSIVDAQVCVNDEPLLVCGVNRHEHDSQSGKVIREELMIQDIKLMKQHNFNAVRNSHYPNTHRWYELCDEYGLFVIDEANIECHGFSKVAHLSLLQNDTDWKNAFLLRTKAMLRRSRIHPCIIGWSLGNESGAGDNSRACADWVRSMDKTRTLQYEGGIQSGDSPFTMGDGCDPYLTDIICPMYDSPRFFAEIESKTTQASGPYRQRPMILCEYAHAMGNSSGNLHQYWDLFRSKDHPRMQGGFIWDWVDQTLNLPDVNDGNEGYGGDFGPTSGKEDKTFCINGMIFADRTPHPAMLEAKFLQRPFNFVLEKDENSIRVDLCAHAPLKDQVSFSCNVFSVKELKPVLTVNISRSTITEAQPNLMVIDASSILDQISKLKIEAPMLVMVASLAKALPYAPKGHVIVEQELEMESFAKRLELCRSSYELKPSSPKEQLKVSLEGKVLGISCANYAAELDSSTGRLSSLSQGQTSILGEDAISHAFYRAPTENDSGGMDTMLPNELLRPFINKSVISFNGTWKKLGLDHLTASTTNVETDKIDSAGLQKTFAVRVFQQHKSKRTVRFTTVTRYLFTHRGVELKVQVTASPSTTTGTFSLPRVGMEFVLPGHFSQLEYLGQGPFECYPDRKAGARLGVHKTSVDEMHTPYVMPEENGGRADVQWAKFTSADTGTALKVTYMFPEKDEVRQEFEDGMNLTQVEPEPSARPSGMCGAQLNASRYSVRDLARAQHQWELPEVGPESPIHVHFDTAHMGLGGDVSWFPKTHKQYRINAKSWQYKLKLEIEP